MSRTAELPLLRATQANCRGVYRSEGSASYDDNIILNRFTDLKGQLDIEIDIQIPGHPFRYGNMTFRQPFKNGAHELTITDKFIALA